MGQVKALKVTTLLFAAALAAAAVPAWAQAPGPAPAPVAAPTGPITPAIGQASSVSDPAYRLGAGDRVRITVYGEDNLSGEFLVSGTGVISFPLIGNIQAGGRTVGDVQASITTALSQGYLRDPRVSAEVLTFRPYYILGEVTRPGEYPYTDGLTVLNAVATAQGFTYRANEKYIFIKHAHDPSEHKEKLTSGMAVEPGDTIRIIERYF